MQTLPSQPPTGATPRSFEVLSWHLRAAVPCPHCDASPGTPCHPGGRGIHLGRFVRGWAEREITARELESLAGRLPIIFTNATMIRGGAR